MAKKCGKCGKPGHYAKTCTSAATSAPTKKRKHRAKAGESWLKTVARTAESKLDASQTANDNSPPPEQVTSEPVIEKGSAEPFADLPPLDLPNSSPLSDESTPASETGEASPSEKSAPKSEPTGQVKIDVAEIEAMLGPFVEQAVRASGAYATEHGFFALGDPFPRLAREAACVIIRKRASEIGVDEEEYAAWLLGGIVGTNGIQAFRAFRKAKAEEDAKKATAKPPSERANVNGQSNGVTPAPAPRPPAAEGPSLFLGGGSIV